MRVELGRCYAAREGRIWGWRGRDEEIVSLDFENALSCQRRRKVPRWR